jgi:serine/threonine protein kinase
MEQLRPGDPRRVGNYRLIGRLGEGGMGQVFLGLSPGGRQVAVKVIHPGYASGRQFRERFAREIEAARRVGGYSPRRSWTLTRRPIRRGWSPLSSRAPRCSSRSTRAARSAWNG